MRVGRITKLGAANAGEAGGCEFLGHSLVVPHPEVGGTAEESRGHGIEAAGNVFLAEIAVLHKARGSAGGGVGEVGLDQLLKVRNNQTEGATGAQVTEDVSEGDTKFVERHMLQNVGAINDFCGLSRDRKPLDHVAVLNVLWIFGKALLF